MIENQAEVEVKKIEHLGLLSAMAKKVGLVEKMDNLLPTKASNNVKVSHGEALFSMILQGLGFSNNRMYLSPDFFSSYALERIFSEGTKPEHFNEAVLGRALDALYKYGPSRFIQDICIGIASQQKLLKKFFHIDTSSFKVTGKYGVDGSIDITHGYSKDHRFDLKQLVFLLVANEDGIPMYSETHSGNASDSDIFTAIVKKLEQDLQTIGESRFFVLDSAVYNKDFLSNGHLHSYWITRVPESIKKAREAVQTVYADEDWVEVDSDYKYIEIDLVYGGVKQRAIVVRNRKSKYKELKTFENKIIKEEKLLGKSRDKLEKTIFKNREEIEAEIKHLKKRFPYFEIGYKINAVKEKRRGIKRRIRVGYTPVIWINRNETKIEKKKLSKGRFIIATNCLDKDELSNEELLQSYRDRNKAVESGFKFLKSKQLRLNQIYLNKESRIEAMMAVLTLILFLNNLCQLSLREELEKTAQTVPDQKGRPTQKPTFAWVAALMKNVTLIKVKLAGEISESVQSTTKAWQTIVKAFGSNAIAIYGLP